MRSIQELTNGQLAALYEYIDREEFNYLVDHFAIERDAAIRRLCETDEQDDKNRGIIHGINRFLNIKDFIKTQLKTTSNERTVD